MGAELVAGVMVVSRWSQSEPGACFGSWGWGPAVLCARGSQGLAAASCSPVTAFFCAAGRKCCHLAPMALAWDLGAQLKPFSPLALPMPDPP